jgi:ankyrin repeat protein
MSKSNNSNKNATLRKVYEKESNNLLDYCMKNDTEGTLSILNNNEIIKYLNYNAEDQHNNRTAFIWACVNKMSFVIDKLIEISKFINNMTKNKKTIYLSSRKNLKFNINQQDSLGKTALMYLCIGKMYDQFAKLIDSYSGCYMLDYNQGGTQYTTGDLDLTIQDDNGNTALRIAVEYCNIEFVEKILEWMNSYDINISANDGNTPLTIAIMKKNLNLIKILLEKIELNHLLENNQLGIIYETAIYDYQNCLIEIYKKIMRSINKLSDEEFETLYQTTEKYVPQFLPELYKVIKFKKNRNNLTRLKKKLNNQVKVSKKINNEAKLQAEELLKVKIEEILTRIESNESKELNGYQIKIIKFIYEIIIKYNFTDFNEYLETTYSTILQNS